MYSAYYNSIPIRKVFNSYTIDSLGKCKPAVNCPVLAVMHSDVFKFIYIYLLNGTYPRANNVLDQTIDRRPLSSALKILQKVFESALQWTIASQAMTMLLPQAAKWTSPPALP